MMIYVRPFSPVGETVSGTSGTVTLSRTGMGTQTLRIVNDGSSLATITLTGPDGFESPGIPILGGSTETFLLPNRVDSAQISGADGTIYFTTGESA